MLSLSELRIVASGLDHPEGVATGPDGLLYAGGEAGQIYRIDPVGGSFEQIADTGGFVLGLALDAQGRVYACDSARAEVVRLDPTTGTVTPYCASAGGRKLQVPNWPAFAPDGSLIVSDSGTEDLDVADGRLLRVPPGGGEADIFDLPPLHFPNGLAVDPGGRIHLLESFTPRLVTILDNSTEVVATFPETVPDGVAVTADGGFVVTCYYPFRLFRVHPGGTVETLLEDRSGIQLPMPTNVSFFGEGLSQLAIAALGGWSINAIGLPFSGAPLHYPDVD
jgi:sugar lactone lactonase YvrE